MKRVVLILAVGILLAPSVAAASIVAGQVDDFEDGTVQNWIGAFIDPPGPPINVASGGPAGADDNYLQVASIGGAGPGSKLATFNDNAQWAGDYLAAGVTAIQVDMKNFSASLEDLEMRLLIPFGAGGNFTSTLSQTLPADGAWHTLTFGLTVSDLTGVDGGTDLNLTLQNVTRILIRHQSGPPTGVGVSPSIVAQMGMDNVTAIPEPATALLLGFGALVVGKRRRRRA
jgi:hypothetical protein